MIIKKDGHTIKEIQSGYVKNKYPHVTRNIFAIIENNLIRYKLFTIKLSNTHI